MQSNVAEVMLSMIYDMFANEKNYTIVKINMLKRVLKTIKRVQLMKLVCIVKKMMKC